MPARNLYSGFDGSKAVLPVRGWQYGSTLPVGKNGERAYHIARSAWRIEDADITVATRRTGRNSTRGNAPKSRPSTVGLMRMYGRLFSLSTPRHWRPFFKSTSRNTAALRLAMHERPMRIGRTVKLNQADKPRSACWRFCPPFSASTQNVPCSKGCGTATVTRSPINSRYRSTTGVGGCYRLFNTSYTGPTLLNSRRASRAA